MFGASRVAAPHGEPTEPCALVYDERMRSAALCVVLAGCELAFPIDPGQGLDGPVCHAQFGAEIATVDLQFLGADQQEFDPAVSKLATELWFVRPEGMLKISVARRAAAGQPFTTAEPAPFSQDGVNEFDPSLTADGKRLLFVRGNEVFEIERAAATDPFGPAAAPADGLPNPVLGLEVSADGLALYFDQGGNLQVARRARRDAAFGAPEDLGFEGEFPTVSADELEIVYNQNGALFRRQRATIDDRFGPPEDVVDGGGPSGGDAELSPDGDTLLFANDSELRLVTRRCD